MRGSQPKDMTGQVFGELTVIERADRAGDHAYWTCRCTCGSVKDIAGRVLRRGSAMSCGCRKSALIAAAQTSHGQSRTLLYRRYWAMIERCTKPTHPGYPRYGGRGIKVCQRWLDGFANYYADVAAGYAPGLQLDRIDNDGDYEPSNVQWITSVENTRKRYNTRFLEHDGQTRPLAEWAEITGISISVIKIRLRRGWPVDRALTEPIHTGVDERPRVTRPAGDRETSCQPAVNE